MSETPLTKSDTGIHVLWAVSARYQRPQFVAAWSDGLVESWHEWYEEKRAEAEEEFRSFGDESDGPWTFWATALDLELPKVPCVCGNGEAEEDRGAVLRCPVHGQELAHG